jgi:hypothetical protein
VGATVALSALKAAVWAGARQTAVAYARYVAKPPPQNPASLSATIRCCLAKIHRRRACDENYVEPADSSKPEYDQLSADAFVSSPYDARRTSSESTL